VVRGPAAVLAACGAALAYFEIASSLPALGDVRATEIVAGATGMLALAVCALALLPARDETPALVAFVVGGGVLAGVQTALHAGPGANATRVLFAAALGLLLARVFDAPAFVIAIPLFAACVDIYSVVSGPSAALIRHQPRAVDYLTFYLPIWGSDRAGQLGVSDLIFFSFYAGFAWQHGLRRGATALALVTALIGVVVAQVVAETALPVLPALALALLLPNLDRLRPMLADARGG
jgi:hypothetical protein